MVRCHYSYNYYTYFFQLLKAISKKIISKEPYNAETEYEEGTLGSTRQASQNKMNLRSELQKLLNVCFLFASAYMFWQGLAIATNSASPIVVVLSGSMEPAFQRGDILFLWNRNTLNQVGDIVVYEVEGKQIPIVHRVLRQHNNHADKQYLLTKGDNNAGNDISLYANKKIYLNKSKEIVGTVKGYFPQLGYITIWISENQYAKFALLGILGLSALLGGE